MSAPKPLCIYHKNCVDGGAAAAVVARKVPDCEFIPMQHGEEPPTVEGRRVWIVDFGLTLERMRAIKAQASEVFWYDHHASQLPIRERLGWGMLDLEECGASLVWRELFPGVTPPPIIPYIKDKDLWQWKLPDSRAVALALDARFRWKWQGVLDADPAELAKAGAPLLAELRARVQTAAKLGLPWDDAFGIKGLRAFVVHARRDQNELGEYIVQPVAEGGLGYDLAVIAYRKRETGRWVHSLRAGRADCAAIAERFNGGGHPNSSCFIADKPVIPLIMPEA